MDPQAYLRKTARYQVKGWEFYGWFQEAVRNGAGGILVRREGSQFLANDGARRAVFDEVPDLARCRFSGLELKVDGRIYSPPEVEPGWYRYRSLPFTLARHYLAGEGLVAKVPDLSAYRREGPGLFLGQRGTFLLSQPSSLCSGWLEIPVELTGPGQLIIIRDGLCLDPVEVDWGCPGLTAFLRDPKIKSDISGLRPIRDRALEQAVEKLQPQAQSLIGNLKEHLEVLRPRLGGSSPGLVAVRGTVLTLLTATAAFGEPASLGFLLFLLGGSMPGARHLIQQRLHTNEREFRELVTQRLQNPSSRHLRLK